MPEPDLNWLREWLNYDASTGIFTWAKTKGHKKKGQVAGSVKADSGYRMIWVDGKQYRAHKLAIHYITGVWPEKYLDHIDGNKDNNSITNLRFATKAQNGHNVGVKSTNTSGVKGVSWSTTKKKWRTYIRISGKWTHLGYFDDLELAELVVQEVRDKYHGEYARHA